VSRARLVITANGGPGPGAVCRT